MSARTTANGIYCPPKMQAALDLQSGIMGAQEQDFKTVRILLSSHAPSSLVLCSLTHRGAKI